MRERRRTSPHVALPLLVMGALCWFSSLPGTPLSDDPALYVLVYWVHPSGQSALHIPAYAALAWVWRWTFGAWLRVPVAAAMVACAIASAYGVFGEWH